ncbi:DUF2922 domain-containing protein [Lactobacillus sp. ESL0228]|uniref:DUF2922 domain-containing protein n=1 Tax=Lactobacillus sp. ESL0228 TaxID=2069352 RepID=UPI000EFBA207|nr:DUF2922 domain-containing protein [Lactobacillus sp. ESL0228]RMC47280.1 DUF2922 domain-containing protein [Lactobacillus sp. ESL0228]
MPTTTKSLQLVFLNSENKKTSIVLPDASDNVTAEAVQSAMTTIAQADAFNKGGVDLYKVPQSAAYVERTVTSVFDHSENKSN